jgi:hypothetical protein
MAEEPPRKEEREPPKGNQDRADPKEPKEPKEPRGPKEPKEERKADAQSDPTAESGAKADQKADQQAVWNLFLQNFNGLNAPGATFGVGSPGAAEAPLYGRLAESEVARVVQAFAEPSCYAEALAELRDQRVVILTGPAGIGKRAAAITMLERVKSPEQRIVGLAPGTTVEQLAARSFTEGMGYVIADMVDASISQEAAEFHWDNACRAVREAGAYLVVTIGTGARIARSATVRSFAWQRPEVADVLRAHLGETVVEEAVIDKVADALGSGPSVRKVAEAARRLASQDGEHVTDLLDELAANDLMAVAEWLDKEDAAIPAVLEAAALAFTVGLSEREFEEELRQLKGKIAEFAPEVDPTNDKVRDEIDLRFRQLRKHRADHPLVRIGLLPVAGTTGSIAVRHVEFAKAAYRSHLIAELWRRLDRDFWTGLRGWLHDIAISGDPDLMASAATGLALLAQQAPDEVFDCYLDPWTAEDASWQEQLMAVYVLWRMSALGDLATLALQIAMQWATQGSRTQRRVATYAFSGELGARFPIDAVRRLTHLAEQGEPMAGNASVLLFVTLATQGSAAAIVLSELQQRMNRKQDRPSADRVLDNIAYLLSIRDPRSGRPAVATFLMANPDRVADTAPLWARSLCVRPWRERAMAALLSTLGAIERGRRNEDGERSPERLVRSLGAAIGEALPSSERAGLRPDLIDRNDRGGRRERSRETDGHPAPPDAVGRHFAGAETSQPQVSRDLLGAFLDACANPN